MLYSPATQCVKKLETMDELKNNDVLPDVKKIESASPNPLASTAETS